MKDDHEQVREASRRVAGKLSKHRIHQWIANKKWRDEGQYLDLSRSNGTSLLNATPENLRRWFAADIAERWYGIYFQRRPGLSWVDSDWVFAEAIITARLAALDLACSAMLRSTQRSIDLLCEELEPAEDLLRTLIWHGAVEPLAKLCTAILSPTGLKKGRSPGLKAARDAARLADACAWDIAQDRRSFAFAQDQEERQAFCESLEGWWQVHRLKYLIDVWVACGDRAPWLLWEGRCPIPWVCPNPFDVGLIKEWWRG